MSEIKERPVLFSAPMVRAILEGRKTVTRRPVKVQPRSKADIGSYGLGQPFIRNPDVSKANPSCPYGRPGDRLWVRETWYCDHDEVQRGPYLQPADMTDLDEARKNGDLVYAADGLTPYEQDQPKWKPSIHTPRWASRILLEITDVRVERLQDISDEQALAEGIIPHVRGGWHWHPHDPANVDDWHQFGFKTPFWAFHDLWAGINGQENWDANPWTWVVEFKQVTP